MLQIEDRISAVAPLVFQREYQEPFTETVSRSRVGKQRSSPRKRTVLREEHAQRRANVVIGYHICPYKLSKQRLHFGTHTSLVQGTRHTHQAASPSGPRYVDRTVSDGTELLFKPTDTRLKICQRDHGNIVLCARVR